MRVKKPTSKRTTTRMREGIKKKAAAKRRKDKKSQRKTLHGNQENPRIQVFQPVFLTRIKS